MSRRNRGSVVHPAVGNLPDGVTEAMNKVQEMTEEEAPKPEPRKVVPSELKDLVLFGKVVDELEIGGFTFKMSTLTNRQQKTLVKRLVKLDNEERLMNIKVFTLAEAIHSINDVPLSEISSYSEEGWGDFEKAVEALSELQSNLVDKLYDYYESLVNKSNSFLKEEGLGDAIKN